MVPLATPARVATGWVWQPVSVQWPRMIDHDSRAAGSAPSCESVAEPAKLTVSPAFHVSVVAGAVMAGTGGVFDPAATGPTAAEVAELVPPALVAATRTRIVVPWSASCGAYVGAVAFAMSAQVVPAVPSPASKCALILSAERADL